MDTKCVPPLYVRRVKRVNLVVASRNRNYLLPHLLDALISNLSLQVPSGYTWEPPEIDEAQSITLIIVGVDVEASQVVVVEAEWALTAHRLGCSLE